MNVFIYLESTLKEHTEHTHTLSLITAVDSHTLIPNPTLLYIGSIYNEPHSQAQAQLYRIDIKIKPKLTL